MHRSIAITGATGFVGRVVLKRLTSMGCHVRALIRPASMHKRPTQVVEWVTGDLEDMESLRRLVAGVDGVVHCAGVVRGAGLMDFERINVAGVARLVLAAREQPFKPRFFLISSLAAREPHLSHYAASKRNGEKALTLNAGRMPWVIFRPPAVYGPGDREMLPLFRWMCRGIAPIIGSAEMRISLLYVEDLAEAIVCCVKWNTGVGRSYEMHDGHTGGYSWEDIIDAIARMNGRTIFRIKVPVPLVRLAATLNVAAARMCDRAPMLTPGKVRELTHPNWVGDHTALTHDTGWVPKISLHEGLRKTLQGELSQI
ncbi:MAG: NAD-dependent epimerase/dehydratase family protein [Deltaproteobacteria bacterium]|nr:NAD-dependent epimerase/dehydratase family protein [Deltaproteobacteria bacterium]